MPRLKEDRRRAISLLKTMRRSHLHTAYLFDANFRREVEDEATYGAREFDDAFITHDLLEDLEALIARSLDAPSGRLLQAAPLPERILAAKSHSGSKGTVLIVPGGAMSQLVNRAKSPRRLLWFNPVVLSTRRFQKLKLAKYAGPDNEIDANPRVKIKPDGPLPFIYDSLEACLCADGWVPEMFAYDWRKNIDNHCVSIALKNCILKHAARRCPVHIVTHSQGGIVARAALAALAQDVGVAKAKTLVGNVIMLGPANYGSFDVALALADSVSEIPFFKFFTSPYDWAQKTLASFTAFYQLMPWSPRLVSSLTHNDHDVRQVNFWNALALGAIDQDRLHVAYPPAGDAWGQALDKAACVFNDQITIIVGSHPSKQTPGGVHFVGGTLQVDTAFDFLKGDGWVPDELAIIPGTTAYRARWTGHIRLPMALKVIVAVCNILDGVSDVGLPFAN